MKPARELLAQVRDRDHWLRGEFPDLELAARVENVLWYCWQTRGGSVSAEQILRRLNGEKEE